jgi:hypothetical protein
MPTPGELLAAKRCFPPNCLRELGRLPVLGCRARVVTRWATVCARSPHETNHETSHGAKTAQLLRPAPMSRCRVSRAAGLGQGALTTRVRPVPRKPPGREGPGKQTSHQLTWKVNRPGGRRPLEAGWARERCGSRPSLSSSSESQPDRRAGSASKPDGTGNCVRFEFSALHQILWPEDRRSIRAGGISRRRCSERRQG